MLSNICWWDLVCHSANDAAGHTEPFTWMYGPTQIKHDSTSFGFKLFLGWTLLISRFSVSDPSFSMSISFVSETFISLPAL